MSHRDDRNGSARDPLFTPGVRRALSSLANEVEEEIPARGSADDHAPPERRLAIVGHRPADYHVNMDQIAAEIERDPKQELKERFRRLTYGDMVAVCEGILAATDSKPISTADELAKVIHRWATTGQCLV